MKLFIALFALVLSGCHFDHNHQKVPAEETLNYMEFFEGEFEGFGTFTNFFGEVERRFTVKYVGKRSDKDGQKVLNLTKEFKFYDGIVKEREWMMSQGGQNYIVGQSDRSHENTWHYFGLKDGVHFEYDYELEMRTGNSILVAMDEKYHEINENVVMGTYVLRKFGFNVGELTFFLRRVN